MDKQDYLDKDLYEILNVEKTATQEEIKVSYRNLMRKYHPDINDTEESRKIFDCILDVVI